MTAILETNESTFSEMTANGTGVAIDDTALRLRISQYYHLTRDRADINPMVEGAADDYRDQLVVLGYSYADRDNLDVETILGNAQVRALIRSIDDGLPYAVQGARELLEANEALQAELKSIQ